MKVPLLVTDFLDRARDLYGDSLAVTCGDEHLTYKRFAERVDRASSALVGMGVDQGDVVAYVSFNCHRLLEAYYAVPQMGAVLLPINIRLSADDIADILNDAGATTAVVDRALTSLIAPIRKGLTRLRTIVSMGGDPGASDPLDSADYETLIKNAPPTFARPTLDEDGTAELFYTSGTTARPKGVMLTHRSLHQHALNGALALRYDDSAVQLHTIPLFHVNGWGTPHALTMTGGRHVMLPRFDAAQVLETIERERVTDIFLVPTMALALLADPTCATRDLRSLRQVMLGGAACPTAVVRALDERLPGCAVMCGYGLTETSPVLTVAVAKRGLAASDDGHREKRSTAGLPIPGVRVEVMDDSGRIMPHDGATRGEIVARGNSVMAGYRGDAEATAHAIVDGWYHTGDLGTIDADGYLRIVDRKKDIIISGGENISSIEIEKAIFGHPAVAECAVIAEPDARWGEVPLAIVVLKPGMHLEQADLIAHCHGSLAGFKIPHRIAFAAGPLPKSGTGKILKRELRDVYLRTAH
ncbi:MAG TPA: long-chain-fatty-acid--CoA ligase [Candidatus Eremiobacteraceae bacterium]|nr:long-chain-fatty-acid--CoA ligase [Candidatus Eremiobacteraceae bacterium]